MVEWEEMARQLAGLEKRLRDGSLGTEDSLAVIALLARARGMVAEVAYWATLVLGEVES